MVKYLENNFVFLCLIPFISICIFSIIFDASVFRFNFAPLFNFPLNENVIAIESGLILVQLSASIIICFGFISVFFGVKNIIENTSKIIDYIYCVLGSIICTIIFFGYNYVGHEYKLTNFVYFTKDIFTENVLRELKWPVDSSIISTLYYAPLFIIIFCSSLLVLTTILMLCGNNNIVENNSVVEVLKNKILCLKYSLYSGALLMSGAIIYIYSWHNMASLAIFDQKMADQFGTFMIYFMLYWGSAYSFVILFTFVPTSMVINKQILDVHNTLSEIQDVSGEDRSNYELIDEIKLNELKYVIAIFSPLITAILSIAPSISP